MIKCTISNSLKQQQSDKVWYGVLMSWQQYIDESLLGTSQVAKASIHGLDGQRYASSAGFVVLPSEAQAILAAITKDPTPVYQKGITLNCSKYVFVKVEPGRSLNCCKGKEGAVAIKTNKCLLIGGYTEGMQAGSCVAVLDKMADFFTANGY